MTTDITEEISCVGVADKYLKKYALVNKSINRRMAHNKSKKTLLDAICDADDKGKALPKLEKKNKKGEKSNGKQKV